MIFIYWYLLILWLDIGDRMNFLKSEYEPRDNNILLLVMLCFSFLFGLPILVLLFTEFGIERHFYFVFKNEGFYPLWSITVNMEDDIFQKFWQGGVDYGVNSVDGDTMKNPNEIKKPNFKATYHKIIGRKF
jgi:hypothetical protein